MTVKLVDDLRDLQLGALIDRVPVGLDWLLRSCPASLQGRDGPFVAHVFDITTLTGGGAEFGHGYEISFVEYADSPEEALRAALRAMRKAASPGMS